MNPLDNIRIVLCETSHPGNIGAAARAMKTMGLARLDLVRPDKFPAPEAEWRATSATDVLDNAKVHSTLGQALHGVALAVACSARGREIAVPQVDPRQAAASAIEVAASQPVAFVFGNETHGLTTEEVNTCQLLATIPTDSRFSSLNLASAVQVFAYELRLASGATAAPPVAGELATNEAVEAFYEHLERTMADIGFLNPEHPKKLMPRLRRLFGRARLEKEEVNILRGVLTTLAKPKKR